jgi:acyl-CoA synthetase (AMP-forming)/AMP-acid ligase II
MQLYMTQALHRSRQQQPERIATICGERQQTYATFVERCAKLAGALQKLGMAKSDRVAMLAFNSDHYLEFYFGTWWGGGAVNPVNIRWSAAEIAYSLDDCGTRILIVDEQFKHHVPALRAQSKSLAVVIYAGAGELPEGMLSYEHLVASAEPVADAGCHGDDLAGVMYTGGTTGFPKGVMLSHENLASNALAWAAAGMTAPDANTLLIAPMFHIAAGVTMNATMLVGGTFVLRPVFNPQATLAAVQAHKITHLILVPTMIQLTVDHADAATTDLSSVRVLAYGGSVISEAVLKRAMQRFPNAGFYQVYGMTELAPIATVLSAEDHRRATADPKSTLLRAAGRAGLVSEIRVVSPDGHEIPKGEVGEVTVRGPGVMLGYWNKPDATRAALQDGWMHTGDAGKMDADGYLYIVDRVKDMIVSGGENVYSAEVENALARHVAVAASAVIGIPDDKWGEAVHAVVVLKPSAQVTADELIAHCHTLIAGYKCPRSVEFRDSLPVTGAGKIQKTELRKPFWEGRSRSVN